MKDCLQGGCRGCHNVDVMCYFCCHEEVMSRTNPFRTPLPRPSGAGRREAGGGGGEEKIWYLPRFAAFCIDHFHCHATKKYIRNRTVEEAKKMKCFKRLIYKQFFQVSGLCGLQFPSYLPKRFTHLCRAFYGDAILVYRFGAPIWPPEINKNIWSSLFL